MRALLTPEDNRTLVITRGLNDCLFIFPNTVWFSRLGKNLPDDLSKEERYELIQSLSSWSTTTRLDKNHRLKISEELSIYANLDKKVIVAGVFDRLEVWNPDSFVKHLKKLEYDHKRNIKDVLI